MTAVDIDRQTAWIDEIIVVGVGLVDSLDSDILNRIGRTDVGLVKPEHLSGILSIGRLFEITLGEGHINTHLGLGKGIKHTSLRVDKWL